jgi:hypothetical protein
MTGLPVIRAIPIYNRSGDELHVMLEPEGDCVTIQPSQVCKIVPQLGESSEAIDLEIECREKMVSVYLNNQKEVYVDGERVR